MSIRNLFMDREFKNDSTFFTWFYDNEEDLKNDYLDEYWYKDIDLKDKAEYRKFFNWCQDWYFCE